MGWLGKQPCRELVFLWGWTETVGSSATSWIFFLSVFGMPNALHRWAEELCNGVWSGLLPLKCCRAGLYHPLGGGAVVTGNCKGSLCPFHPVGFSAVVASRRLSINVICGH